MLFGNQVVYQAVLCNLDAKRVYSLFISARDIEWMQLVKSLPLWWKKDIL